MAEWTKEERESVEEELAAILLLIWASQLAAVWATEQRTAAEFRRMLEEAGAPQVVDRVIGRSAENFAAEVGGPAQPMRPQDMVALRERYLDELATRMAQRQVAYAREYADARLHHDRTTIGVFEPPEPYSEAQAVTEAVTSVTTVVSQTEREGARNRSNDAGISLHPFWVTEPGACKICQPLHNRGKEAWGARFPDGPPAHPNCRCHLQWLPVL